MHLFKVKNSDIHNEFINVKDKDFFHIKKVLRKKINDIIFFTDSESLYETKIIEMQKNFLQCKIINKQKFSLNKNVIINLYLSLIKFSHFETTLNYATQLGIKRIFPMITHNRIGTVQNHINFL